MVVHVDARVLADAEHPGQSVLDDGVRVSAQTSQRLACDASRVVMRHDGEGRLLEVGARTRTIPPALRRALEHRDQGCRFPGCHGAVHEEGYQVERQADGELKFRHPQGWAIPYVLPRIPVPDDPVQTIRARNASQGLELDAHIATPGWRGERLDVAYAIDVLQVTGRVA